MTDEEKVRAAHGCQVADCWFPTRHTTEAHVEHLKKAAVSTAARQQAIADVDEEIAEIREGVAASSRVMWDMEAIERTIARLEAHRADMARGMKA